MSLNEDRRNTIILAIMIITLLINFTGLRFIHIITLYQSLFGESQADTLNSLDNPIIFSGNDVLVVSPEFIYVQKISLEDSD